jgi:hypothetical protein
VPKARLVDHPNGLWVAQLLKHLAAQIVAHHIDLPNGTGKQALHPIWSGFSCILSQLPPIFARSFTHDPSQIRQGTMAWFGSSKPRGNARMQAL